ncbi:MAG: nucleoside-triphosphatase [Bacteroidales bacterium]|jgi:nucleoside-triphosphatase THEP1|nr:nucleoside-triphosphatase [Bacteroidales bacterium]
MPRIFSARINKIWLKAAIVGSLWASFEIIIGSFLHNMRFPFAGTILAFSSVGLIIAFIQVWKDRGLVWRAGLIAALLKSMSPSAIILGPMIGIFSEAVIIEFCLLVFGRNLPAYMFAGGMAVLSALFHKIVSLLVTYGFDLIIIVEQLYRYLIRQLGMTEGNPEILVGSVMAAYFLAGMFGALLGYYGGKMALAGQARNIREITPDRESRFFKENAARKTSPWLLIFHLFAIVASLYLLNVYPLQYAFIPSLLYASFCLYRYKGSMRSFRKPSFWIWFMAITMLAAIFWNGFSSGEIWNKEGLLVGLKMNLRAMVILTGFASLSTELRNPIIRTVLYHHGFANLYHAVGLAFSVLPGIIDSIPGVKKLLASPVKTLGSIVEQASDVFPALEKEIASYSPVIIITGNVGQGKTSFLLELIELLKSGQLHLAGFIARGIHENDDRIGYDLEDITSGKTCEFIRKERTANWFRHGKYYFNPEGIRFGTNILEKVDREKTDLLIIDEIGPVELKGKGWSDIITSLVKETGLMQLWVVRNHILKRVIRNWKIGDILILDVEKDVPAAAAGSVVRFIKEHRK